MIDQIIDFKKFLLENGKLDFENVNIEKKFMRILLYYNILEHLKKYIQWVRVEWNFFRGGLI